MDANTVFKMHGTILGVATLSFFIFSSNFNGIQFNSLRKEFAPLGAIFFYLRVDLILEGICQKFTKYSPVEKIAKKAVS